MLAACLFLITLPDALASKWTKKTSGETLNESYELQQKIQGKIIDKEGLPLPGATVLEKGTNNGTVTDFDGNFTLSLST